MNNTIKTGLLAIAASAALTGCSLKQDTPYTLPNKQVIEVAAPTNEAETYATAGKYNFLLKSPSEQYLRIGTKEFEEVLDASRVRCVIDTIGYLPTWTQDTNGNTIINNSASAGAEAAAAGGGLLGGNAKTSGSGIHNTTPVYAEMTSVSPHPGIKFNYQLITETPGRDAAHAFTILSAGDTISFRTIEDVTFNKPDLFSAYPKCYEIHVRPATGALPLEHILSINPTQK
jgi:hypothetical protein